ncbi:NAD(P)-binding protein [Hypoxylon sp. FL1150]|nr:NAD(P)-binding protein [Hypoxylon sp. FL1150]
MATSTILVIGATGKQGGSVLTELAHLLPTLSPQPRIKVLALTRAASSPKAQALPRQHPTLDLEVVEGDSRDPAPLFAAHPDITAVFSYTTPPDEEPQAAALVDAAAAHARSRGPGQEKLHFVFSSVDRGGEEKSWGDPTDVEHFLQKHNVELRLRKTCEASAGSMTYTILRPVAFMDNLNPGTFGTVFAAMWHTMPSSQKLQLVSVRDIGLFAAKALLNPDASGYRNRAVGLAGDELTLDDARAVFKRVSGGADLPQAWYVVGWGVRNVVAGRHVGKMFSWFERGGYGVDVAALRAREPRLQSFEAWLRESSKFGFSEAEKST